MHLTELLVAVSVIGLIASTDWLVRQEQLNNAMLEADFAAVQGVAHAYAQAHCVQPPRGPIQLDRALTQLGRTALLSQPADWSLVLSPSTGTAGVGIRIRYATNQDSLSARYLLQQPGAHWLPNCCVEIALSRPAVSPQRSSFQFLFEGAAC